MCSTTAARVLLIMRPRLILDYLEKAGIIPKDGEKKRTSPNDRKRKALATPPNEEVDEDDKLSYTRKLEVTLLLVMMTKTSGDYHTTKTTSYVGP